ncbi:uncharacterized protein KQ657_001725 [Scheffersomyces spartinae]|uniref:Uncharacterized protein n=1 Tax=Scheffersomyces spartinae TaxID=45513 RepID=A0A9P7V761_9ASCO|nr:uncharacterized protein KQ657_001725 [Scheffersomyces spartinae]KAG7192623.1 hypothetical protein KQ657_001725 [Scheffersomyces spartinae]
MKISVISGGTATNELVQLFESITPNVSYILPISDNGGSTSELIRVIGGPAIGDIRSRLTRLIPLEQKPLQKLLSFRLSSDSRQAKQEWNEIIEGTHPLWKPIPVSTREVLRSFLIHINVELLKRSKHLFAMPAPTGKEFRYELANVGNLFLTGIRLFVGSLDSAIELFARVTSINPKIEVLPCINTNFPYHISALLENGLIITGQSQISHPATAVAVNTSPSTSSKHTDIISRSTLDVYPPPISQTRETTPHDDESRTAYFGVPIIGTQPHETPVVVNEVATCNRRSSILHDDENHEVHEEDEVGNIPQYTHPDLRISQLHFNKHEIEPLLSPIQRIFYVSPYGQEIRPIANYRVTQCLNQSDMIVYSIGSLMTSIIPVIILRGIGRAIISGSHKKRVLLLNGCHDRETLNMDAYDFVKVIVELALYSLSDNDNEHNYGEQHKNIPWNRIVTHLVFMESPKIHVDVERIESKGIQCVKVTKQKELDYYDTNDLERALKDII